MNLTMQTQAQTEKDAKYQMVLDDTRANATEQNFHGHREPLMTSGDLDTNLALFFWKGSRGFR